MRTRVDAGRLAVIGHSMGGGGALDAAHNYIGQPSTILARTMIPWLKIFVDDDARYSQFLCPTTNTSGIRTYRNSCPLISTAVATR